MQPCHAFVALFLLIPAVGFAAAFPVPIRATCDLADVHFAGPEVGLAVGFDGCALLTEDTGASWVDVSFDARQSLVAAYALDARTLYAARNALFRSVDGGASWHELGTLEGRPLGDIASSIFDLHFADRQRIQLIKGGSILASTDAGATFRVLLDAGFVDELHFPSANVGYATGGITFDGRSSADLAKTTDGGASWRMLETTLPEITAADFFSADIGLAATIDGRARRTVDGGATWSDLGPVFADAALADAVVDLGHRDFLQWFAVTSAGRVLESDDGGASWRVAYTDVPQRALTALAVNPDRYVAVGSSGLILTEEPFGTCVVANGLSGTWYAPEKSGQGLTLEIQLASRPFSGDTLDVFAAYYGYGSDRDNHWLAGSVQLPTRDPRDGFGYVYAQATVPMFSLSGGDFGNALQPMALAQTSWGELTITPTIGCNSITVELSPTNRQPGSPFPDRVERLRMVRLYGGSRRP